MTTKPTTHYYIYARVGMLLTAVLLLAACHRDHHGGDEPPLVSMPVYISIPATDIGETRAPGDPGTYEKFGLPRYLCLVMFEVQTDGTRTLVAKSMNLDLGEGSENWIRTSMTADNNPALTPSMGDSVYTYVGRQITINLPQNRGGKSAEVYAAMSPHPFLKSGTATALTADDLSGDFSEFCSLTVDFEADASGSYAYLRDVYSTPANLQSGGAYYGTVASESYVTNYPELRLVLYHVAAKLDLQWNVTDADIKAAGGITALTVNGLKHQNCHLFRPMTNEGAGVDTYSETFTTDLGNCYYGRQSFYVIPYVATGTTSYPVAMQATWGSPSATRSATHLTPLSTDAVFTPWIVGALNIK